MNQSAMNSIKRGMLFLEEEDFDKAEEYFEKALNEDAECADAYLGLLLCDRCCKSEEDLISLGLPVNEERNYSLAVRFATEKDKERYEQLPKKILDSARKKAMICADNGDYDIAYGWCEHIGEQETEYARFYKLGKLTENFSSTDKKIANAYAAEAKKLLDSVTSEDLKSKLEKCHSAYTQLLNEAEEAARLERLRAEEERLERLKKQEEEKKKQEEERQAKELEKKREEEEREKKRIEQEKQLRAQEAREKKRKIAFITVGVVVVALLAAFIAVFATVIYPSIMYDSALSYMNSQEYEKAIREFTDLEDYKDSVELAKKANYLFAEQCFNAKEYEKAMSHYTAAEDYEDAARKYIESHKAHLASIGDYKGIAIQYNVEEITILPGTGQIAGYALSGATSVTTIRIPSSVKKIDWGAFQGCTGLVSIYYEGTMEEWGYVSKSWYWDTDTGNYTVYCSDGNIQKQAS